MEWGVGRRQQAKVQNHDFHVNGNYPDCNGYELVQGRMSTDFDDRNEDLLACLSKRYPNALSLEMETFHLFDLARCSGGRIKAAAMAIALAERYTNDFIAASEIEKLEKLAGLAALTTLYQYELGNGRAGQTSASNMTN